MKKIILLAAALTVIAACNKQGPVSEPVIPVDGPVEPVLTSETLTVTLFDEAGTRATSPLTGTVKGEKVTSATIFVFGPDGNALDHKAAELVSDVWQASFTLTKATDLTVAAVVNKSVDGVTTISSLRAKTSVLGDNSDANGFVMYGEKSGISTGGSSAVSIDVKHQAVMVEIDKITTNFKEGVYQDKSFVLKGVYLINVATGTPAFSAIASYTPNAWANQCQYVSNASLNGLIAETGLNVDMKMTLNGGSYVAKSNTTKHYFYAYPNNTATDNTGDTWSSAGAYTRLVVEMLWNGSTTWYYPISIGPDRCKPNYKVIVSELVITKPGSDHPNKPIESDAASFNINVLDWTTSNIGQVTL